MRRRSDGARTRDRILIAAAEVFAQRGFRDATFSEIAASAEVNTALINYHFNDKETLYIKAWEFAQEQTFQKYRLNESNLGDEPWERLRTLISALVYAAADPKAADQEIWRKEVAQPTGLMAEIHKKMVIPLRRRFSDTIREILPKGTSEETICLATMSVISQCRVPVCGARYLSSPAPFIQADLETRIEHIYRFSLGGLSALSENVTQ